MNEQDEDRSEKPPSSSVHLGGFVDPELAQAIESEANKAGVVGDYAAFAGELLREALEEWRKRRQD